MERLASLFTGNPAWDVDDWDHKPGVWWAMATPSISVAMARLQHTPRLNSQVAAFRAYPFYGGWLG